MIDECIMCMQHWWSYTDREKIVVQGGSLSYCHFVHNKSHMD